VKCSNCGGEIHTGEATKPGTGGWRHPSKCGNELRDLVVRRPAEYPTFTTSSARRPSESPESRK
jgi:hypothetical protein